MTAPVRIATIGTSLIAERFLEALSQVPQATHQAVYSRSLEQAQRFAQRSGAPLCFDSLEELAAEPSVDAVYIASPNMLHIPQAQLMIDHGKHVLIEKSLAPNYGLAADLFQQAAQTPGLLVMEAMRSLYTPGFEALEQALERVGELQHAHFTYAKVTSRIGAFRRGEQVNIFDSALAAGALMDLGVYTVEPAVYLFGKPHNVTAHATVVEAPSVAGLRKRPIDVAGTAVLEYEGYTVVLTYGKTYTSSLRNQICGTQGTLHFAEIGCPHDIHFVPTTEGAMVFRAHEAQQVEELLPVEEPEFDMACELTCFCQAIQGDVNAQAHITKANQASLDALAVMDEIRKQAGIVFPVDATWEADE